MYAIIYIGSDAEPLSGYGPFDSAEQAEDAFDTIRDDDPNDPALARTIELVPVDVDDLS
jgi:hypothetical protein